MITLKDINLNNAYKNQKFNVPFFRENQGIHFDFEVELKDTYAKGYTLNMQFQDDEDNQVFDDVIPSGFFSKTELQNFESLVFSKAVKDELNKQKKQVSKK